MFLEIDWFGEAILNTEQKLSAGKLEDVGMVFCLKVYGDQSPSHLQYPQKFVSSVEARKWLVKG